MSLIWWVYIITVFGKTKGGEKGGKEGKRGERRGKRENKVFSLSYLVCKEEMKGNTLY